MDTINARTIELIPAGYGPREETFGSAHRRDAAAPARRRPAAQRSTAQQPRRQTRSRQHAGLGRALVLAVILAIFLVQGTMGRASADEKVKYYRYYDNVTVGYGQTLEDLVDRYADAAHYPTTASYVKDLCQVNRLSFDQHRFPEVHAGDHLILPYYSTQKK